MKTLKVQTPSLNLEAIAEVLAGMDILYNEKLDMPGAISDAGLPKKTLRKLFEGCNKNSNLDFTTAETGNYCDVRVENIYLGFKYALVQYRRAIHDTRRKMSRDAVKAPFIIGMQVSDNTVQFGYRPYKHNSVSKAQKEADKLRERNGKSYTIFGVVGESLFVENGRAKRSTPVEETKQGTVGKLVRSPFKVMENWKKIVLETDITAVSIPVSIGFTAGGRYCVNYSMSQGSQYFDEYSQCIEFIDGWIRDYRATHPEETPGKEE